ncbi:MAG: sugar phosphate isomerase/epimerase [Clostridia bacterium]|nr:sugar phosphate isomerase/epimerase [Clostridia bacterium]
MKKSINAWAFPAEMTFEDVFKKAKEHGFEAIELNVDGVGENKHSFNYESTDADFEHVNALIKKYGIEVQSVSSGLYWTVAPFASEIPEKRAEAIKVLRTQLRCAKAIGADGILVVPCVDNDLGLKKSFDNTIEVFRSMKDEIAESGVRVGLENVWNQFFLSPMDVKYVLDGIDDKNVGMYFDAGNMIEFSNPEWWIDIIGESIVKVHLKNSKRINGFHSGVQGTKLLEGDVNWDAVVPRLAKVYDGAMTAELFPSAGTDIDEFLEEVSDALTKIIAIAK